MLKPTERCKVEMKRYNGLEELVSDILREVATKEFDESSEQGVRAYELFEEIKDLETKISTASMILGHTLFEMRMELNQDTIDLLWDKLIDFSTDFAQQLHENKIEERTNGN